jgi:hypothetical protein
MFVREQLENGHPVYRILESYRPQGSKTPKHRTVDPDEAYKIALEDFNKAQEKLCLIDRIRSQRRKRRCTRNPSRSS